MAWWASDGGFLDSLRPGLLPIPRGPGRSAPIWRRGGAPWGAQPSLHSSASHFRPRVGGESPEEFLWLAPQVAMLTEPDQRLRARRSDAPTPLSSWDKIVPSAAAVSASSMAPSPQRVRVLYPRGRARANARRRRGGGCTACPTPGHRLALPCRSDQTATGLGHPPADLAEVWKDLDPVDQVAPDPHDNGAIVHRHHLQGAWQHCLAARGKFLPRALPRPESRYPTRRRRWPGDALPQPREGEVAALWRAFAVAGTAHAADIQREAPPRGGWARSDAAASVQPSAGVFSPWAVRAATGRGWCGRRGAGRGRLGAVHDASSLPDNPRASICPMASRQERTGEDGGAVDVGVVFPSGVVGLSLPPSEGRERPPKGQRVSQPCGPRRLRGSHERALLRVVVLGQHPQ